MTMTEIPEVPDEIADAAPSRKLIVWALLLSDEQLTQEELRERTGLSPGATSESLQELHEAGLVEKSRDPHKLIRHRYEIQI